MSLNSHKDLIVWQKSIILAKEIYLLAGNFPKSEIFGITSQMRRCVVSIASNIAEGYGRKSRNEYNQFLSISYGSSLELETQLIIAKSTHLASDQEFTASEAPLLEVLKMLNAMTRGTRR